MNRHILLLLILALTLPLFQGQRGCGGSIRFGDEEGFDLDVSDAVAPGVLSDAADEVTAPHMVPDTGPGPAGIMTSDEIETGPGEEAEIDDSGLNYLPGEPDVVINIGMSRLSAVSMDHAVMNTFAPHVSQFTASLNMAISEEELMDLVSDLTLACESGAAGGCKEILGLATFREPFLLSAAVSGAKALPESGDLYMLGGANVAAQLTDRIIACGSENLVKAALSAAGGNRYFEAQKRHFEPATIFFSVAADHAEGVMSDPGFSMFRFLYKLIEPLGERDLSRARYIGALDFINPSIGAAIYEERRFVMKAALSLDSYEDFVEIMRASASVARDPLKESGESDAMVRYGAPPAEEEALRSSDARVLEPHDELSELTKRAEELRAVIAGTVDMITITNAQRELAEVEARIDELKRELSSDLDGEVQEPQRVH